MTQPSDLSLPEQQALVAIVASARPGTIMGAMRLGTFCGIPSVAAEKLLVSLVEKGLVIKPRKSDSYGLTEAGEAVLMAMLQAPILEGYNDDRLKGLLVDMGSKNAPAVLAESLLLSAARAPWFEPNPAAYRWPNEALMRGVQALLAFKEEKMKAPTSNWVGRTEDQGPPLEGPSR